MSELLDFGNYKFHSKVMVDLKSEMCKFFSAHLYIFE